MASRRRFLRILTGAAASFTLPLNPLIGSTLPVPRDKWGELLPLNTFGNTGKKVTMMGLGGFHVGRMTDSKAQETIETAIAGGIRFFDTAESYVGGEAEIKYGKFLSPTYRDDIFLMSKTKARNRKDAEDHLRGSLKRMKTDRIDLWLMHAVNSVSDIRTRIDEGVFDVMLEAKQKGIVKHIGFSGHTTFKAHQYMLEKNDVMEVCMLPINAIDLGHESFIENIVPVLMKKNKGIIAMKTLAGGSFFGRGFDGRQDSQDRVMDHISVDEAISFALTIPNDVLVTGPKTPEMLQEKIDIAKSFRDLSDEELKHIFSKIQHLSGKSVEYYKGRE